MVMGHSSVVRTLGVYVCMYGHAYTSKSMDQPAGKVARENEYFQS